MRRPSSRTVWHVFAPPPKSGNPFADALVESMYQTKEIFCAQIIQAQRQAHARARYSSRRKPVTRNRKRSMRRAA